jgi:hypothetical protein
LISVFAWQINAQINEVGRLYIAPKIGYNMANITLLDVLGANPRHGLNVGISGEYVFDKMFAIESGLFYSMQGSSFKMSTLKLGLNSDYLNLPVLLKAYVADGLNIFAGPQFGYLLSSRMNIKTGSKLIDEVLGILSDNIDFRKYEKEFDVAIVAGLGYQLENGFNISANYSLGMIKVPDLGNISIDGVDFPLDLNAKNNVLQVNVGYRF